MAKRGPSTGRAAEHSGAVSAGAAIVVGIAHSAPSDMNASRAHVAAPVPEPHCDGQSLWHTYASIESQSRACADVPHDSPPNAAQHPPAGSPGAQSTSPDKGHSSVADQRHRSLAERLDLRNPNHAAFAPLTRLRAKRTTSGESSDASVPLCATQLASATAQGAGPQRAL
jgi:hypothetical protein